MIELGKYNDLKIFRQTDNGWYLWDEDGHEVLLPNRYTNEEMEAGDEIQVFVYNDSEDRITATLADPKILLHQFAFLEVKEVTTFGAFLDWGLEKDLLVPFSQQTTKMQKGESYVVYMYLDEVTDRLAASAKLSRFFEQDEIPFEVGQEVDLLIADESELGMTAVINDIYGGLIYRNEIFKKVVIGDRCKGYIKLIREDNKIDLTLEKPGYANVRPSADVILDKLKANDGFLAFNDKSDPDLIREEFEMSKKVFKKAIGGLYKHKIIRIEKDGIHLINEKGL